MFSLDAISIFPKSAKLGRSFGSDPLEERLRTNDFSKDLKTFQLKKKDENDFEDTSFHPFIGDELMKMHRSVMSNDIDDPLDNNLSVSIFPLKELTQNLIDSSRENKDEGRPDLRLSSKDGSNDFLVRSKVQQFVSFLDKMYSDSLKKQVRAMTEFLSEMKNMEVSPEKAFVNFQKINEDFANLSLEKRAKKFANEMAPTQNDRYHLELLFKRATEKTEKARLEGDLSHFRSNIQFSVKTNPKKTNKNDIEGKDSIEKDEESEIVRRMADDFFNKKTTRPIETSFKVKDPYHLSGKVELNSLDSSNNKELFSTSQMKPVVSAELLNESSNTPVLDISRPIPGFSDSLTKVESKPLLMTPDELTENVHSVLEKSQILLRKGGGELRMTLNPKGLGELNIRLEIVNSEVQIEIFTERPEVRVLLEKGIGELREAFKVHSLDLQKVDIGSSLSQLDSESGKEEGKGQSLMQGFLRDFRQERSGLRQNLARSSGQRVLERPVHRAEMGPGGWRSHSVSTGKSLNVIA